MGSRKNIHFETIDSLRGLAALAVMLYHFGYITLPTLKPNLLSDFFYFGSYGVIVFFVISGFVIPYSMHSRQYILSDFPQYMWRRIIRVWPASFLSIFLFMGFYYGAFYILGRPVRNMDWPGINLLALFSNYTYTVPFFGQIWYSPVFWTLAIEFQFYLLIGFLYPFIIGSNMYVKIVLVCLFCIASLVIPVQSFFLYSSAFAVGIILFLKKAECINSRKFHLLLPVALALCYLQLGLTSFIFVILTALLIEYWNFSNKVLRYLGKISYSLYLTHMISGIVFEVMLKNSMPFHHSECIKIIMILVYSGGSIIVADLFYRFVENKFISLSKRSIPKSHVR